MERIANLLGSGEEPILSSRQHPVVLVKPLLLWVAMMTGVTVAGVLLLGRTDHPMVDRVISAIVLGATGYAVVNVLQWWARRYVITEERLMLVSGLLTVQVTSVPFSKVNDTTFTRSVWGRLFGYGELILKSRGDGPGLPRLVYLPKPREAYRLLTSLLSAREASGMGPQQRRQWPGMRLTGQDDTGPLPRFG